MATPVVLVVDDEAPLRESLRFAFARDGFDVLTAPDGHAALAALRASTPSAVVLDVNLPGVDGFTVCREVRASSDVPIVMLTARDTANDRLAGLEIGADDYVTKPFSTKELVARVRAVMRRHERAQARLDEDRALVARLEELAARLSRAGSAGAGAPQGAAPIDAGRVSIDPGRGTVRVDGGAPRTLAAHEVRLLTALARERGRVVTRTDLVRATWGDFPADAQALLDATVRALRAKLEPNPDYPVLLLTVPGIGYRLA